MPLSPFEAMRARLIARGLICPTTGRLTDAGNVEVDRIIAERKNTVTNHATSTVRRWNTRR